MDATYRGDLRELNELNYARFDAKLEQRLAAFKLELEERIVRLEVKLDSKLDTAVFQHAIAQLGARIERVEANQKTALAELRTDLQRGLRKQTRWLVLALSSLLIPLAGLWLRG